MLDQKVLLDRNQAFAANYVNDLHHLPNMNSFILTCIDPRVDPTHYLGLELGDAFIFRNAGARLTADIQQEIAILSIMLRQIAGKDFTSLDLMIVHHTDCGMQRLANPETAQLISEQLALDQETLNKLAIPEHFAFIKADIERAQKTAVLPPNMRITGYLYDVHTGLITEIVAATQVGQ